MTRHHPEAAASNGAVKARLIEAAVLSDLAGDPIVQRVWSGVVGMIKQWSAIVVRANLKTISKKAALSGSRGAYSRSQRHHALRKPDITQHR
jgi:hypothetical protein